MLTVVLPILSCSSKLTVSGRDLILRRHGPRCSGDILRFEHDLSSRLARLTKMLDFDGCAIDRASRVYEPWRI